MSYPKTIHLQFTDGDGEAVKSNRNEPWEIAHPLDGFRFYGSKPQVKAEIQRRYPDVSFPTKDS